MRVARDLHGEARAAAPGDDGLHLGAGAQRAPRRLHRARERADELAHPAAERLEGARRPAVAAPRPGGAGAGGALGEGAADQAAVLPLQRDELGEGGRDAERVDVARVDAPEQRRREPLERLAPEPPADEAPDGLVARVVPPRQDEIEPHARLARPREERAPGEGEDARGDRQDEALRERVQDAVALDVDLAVPRVGLDEPVAEAEVAAELGGLGAGGDERVGPALDDEAVAPLGDDVAAEVGARLEERDGEGRAGAVAAGAEEAVGGGEAGDASADDDDAVHERPGSKGRAYTAGSGSRLRRAGRAAGRAPAKRRPAPAAPGVPSARPPTGELPFLASPGTRSRNLALPRYAFGWQPVRRDLAPTLRFGVIPPGVLDSAPTLSQASRRGTSPPS